jgi:hypothetical protein
MLLLTAPDFLGVLFSLPRVSSIHSDMDGTEPWVWCMADDLFDVILSLVYLARSRSETNRLVQGLSSLILIHAFRSSG